MEVKGQIDVKRFERIYPGSKQVSQDMGYFKYLNENGDEITAHVSSKENVMSAGQIWFSEPNKKAAIVALIEYNSNKVERYQRYIQRCLVTNNVLIKELENFLDEKREEV